MIPKTPFARVLLPALLAGLSPISAAPEIGDVLERVRDHDFHPVRDGFTFDRALDKHGVANLADDDWRVRTLAVRDLVAADDAEAILAALGDDHRDVRYLAAMALGIRRESAAVKPLAELLISDPRSTVRSQAAIALGQIGGEAVNPALRHARDEDASRDVRHQATLSLRALETGRTATPELAEAWAGLDPDTFATAEVGQPAPDFTLPDTEGEPWRLSDFRGKQAVALIWVFADWCPVCHGEFRDLIEWRQAFEKAGIQPITLECHDNFRARVMVGKEIEPDYWFAEKPFHETYRDRIHWPHLVDRAAQAGVRYDVQPLAYAVHAEYINRPTVALIDKDGILRFLYRGTYWGDRPTIREILEMMRSGDYDYAAPKRLEAP